MKRKLRVCLSATFALLMLASVASVSSGEAGPVRDGRDLFDYNDYIGCGLDGGGHHQCIAESYVCMCSSTQEDCTLCGYE